MKVKIRRLNDDWTTYKIVDAWAVVSPKHQVSRMSGRLYYPLYSAPVDGIYWGYYAEHEFIDFEQEETPTQVLPEWGPVMP